MTRNKLRLLLGLFAAALVWSALPTTPAAAGTYEIDDCSANFMDERSFLNSWSLTHYGTWTDWPVDDCPRKLSFETTSPMTEGMISLAYTRNHIEREHPDLYESNVRELSFKYRGGDMSGDIRYSVMSCVGLYCHEIETLPVADEADGWIAHTVYLPPGVPKVGIQMQCVSPICESPTPYAVKDLKVTWEDKTPPTIEVVSTVPSGALDAGSEVPVSADRIKLKLRMNDYGSGVERFGFGIYDISKEVSMFVDCTYPPNDPSTCSWGYDDGFELVAELDISEIPDGEYDFNATAVDYSGEHGASFHRLRIDRTPPSDPSNIAFSGAVQPSGWTSDPTFTVAFDRPTDEDWHSAVLDLKSLDGRPPPPNKTVTDLDALESLTIPSEGRWDVGVTFTDAAGNKSNREHKFIGYDADAPFAPELDVLDWLSIAEVRDGAFQTWTPPTSNSDLESGICAYVFVIDDEQHTIPEPVGNVPHLSSNAMIAPNLKAGEHWAHLRAIGCNGRASETSTAPVYVDELPPVAKVQGLGSTGWIGAEGVLRIIAADDASGVESIEYGFDETLLTTEHGSSVNVPIVQGSSTLYYRAIDRTGNQSALESVQVDADWTPPETEIGARSVSDPALIVATAEDSHSGLAQIGLQYRAKGSGGPWTTMGELVEVAATDRAAASVSRRIPDQLLPPGFYEIRLFARDLAGNVTDKAQAEVTLPLREEAVLDAAIAAYRKVCKTNTGRKCRSVSTCKRSQRCRWVSELNLAGAARDKVLKYGRASAIVGSLLDRDARPIAGAEVSIVESPEFGVPAKMSTVTTDAEGRFVKKLVDGPTTRYQVEFGGAPLTRSDSTEISRKVHAAVRMKIKQKVVRSWRPFRVSGKLLSAGVGLPEGGKIISIEYLRGRRWWPTIGRPRVDSRGSFSALASGVGVKERQTVYFRAVAEKEGTWPFFTGYSEPVPVVFTP